MHDSFQLMEILSDLTTEIKHFKSLNTQIQSFSFAYNEYKIIFIRKCSANCKI